MKLSFDNWEIPIIPTIILFILLPLLLYFSYWLLITGIIGFMKMNKSKKWKHIIGKITNAEIRFMKFGTYNDGDESLKFVLKKTYLYTIENQIYVSSNDYASDYIYDKNFKPLSKLPKRFKGYKNEPEFIQIKNQIDNLIGLPTTVYYNPKNPKQSCLTNRLNKEVFLPIIMGLVFSTLLTSLAFFILKVIIK